MQADRKTPLLSFPQTISEALGMAARNPDAEYWAGGTTFHSRKAPEALIVLSGIEELHRAIRTEHSLEIGAMTTLDRLAEIGHKLPIPILQDAIGRIAVLPIRSQATIGGHLAQKGKSGDLLPLLRILDAKVEIRSQRKIFHRIESSPRSQKIPLAGIHHITSNLHREGLITRISIPTSPWNIGKYVKIQPGTDEERFFIFCALARVDNGIVTEFRMAVFNEEIGIQYDLELEAAMVGRTLPFTDKDRQNLNEALNRMSLFQDRFPYDRKTTLELVQGFFSRASQ